MKEGQNVTTSRIAVGKKRDKNYFNSCAENEPRLDLCKGCTLLDECLVRKAALQVKSRN